LNIADTIRDRRKHVRIEQKLTPGDHASSSDITREAQQDDYGLTNRRTGEFIEPCSICDVLPKQMNIELQEKNSYLLTLSKQDRG
jgi:hypothetical protein